MNTYFCDLCKTQIDHDTGIPVQGKLKVEFLSHTIEINIGLSVSEKSAGVDDVVSAFNHVEGSALCDNCLVSAVTNAVKQKNAEVVDSQDMNLGKAADAHYLDHSQTIRMPQQVPGQLDMDGGANKKLDLPSPQGPRPSVVLKRKDG